MRRLYTAALAALALVFAGAPAFSSNLNFLFGGKTLESSDWSPVEDQGAFGIHVDGRPPDWPVSISIDLLGSAAEADLYGFGGVRRYEASTSEFDVGFRKYFGEESYVAPFIGGGVGIISASIRYTNFSTGERFEYDDSALGPWFDLGVAWRVGEHLNLGLDLRFSTADVKLGGVTVDAGGTTFGFFMGYGW